MGTRRGRRCRYFYRQPSCDGLGGRQRRSRRKKTRGAEENVEEDHQSVEEENHLEGENHRKEENHQNVEEDHLEEEEDN